ncbi:site-specific integrase [Halarcobacter sp.]|uniref:site-specific integrase n=1 Tax=Halarcobacter sp. TaxID=2321133 RepID=UPI0029F5B365|nr:site-specific integrase [Halarcobacter sp.]
MIKRHKVYYFKRRVPKVLKEFYPNHQHIVKSLNTKEITQAKIRYDELNLELDKLIFLYSHKLINTEAVLDRLSYIKLLPSNKIQKRRVLMLSDIKKLFIKDAEVKSKWTDKTAKEIETVLVEFLNILSDRPINEVNREDLWYYRDILFKLPLNYSKKSKYRNKTIKQILKMDISNDEKLSIVTVDKKLSKVVTYFRFAFENGYIKDNPSTNLTVNSKIHKQPYKAYSKEDIQRLFTSPLYTTDIKMKSKRPEWYWLPLIALYSGMRQTEIAQLYVKDIRQEQGVWVFDINKNTPDKKVKNKSSIRLVPIHKELIRLGFLDYAFSLKEERLWMNLNYGKDGYATSYTKHHYSLYNRKYISKDKKKVFHSFRKTFITNLEQLTLLGEINHNAVKALVGHSFNNDITLEVYTQSFDIKILKKVVDKFKWN